jgi:hypothetical protein
LAVDPFTGKLGYYFAHRCLRLRAVTIYTTMIFEQLLAVLTVNSRAGSKADRKKEKGSWRSTDT